MSVNSDKPVTFRLDKVKGCDKEQGSSISKVLMSRSSLGPRYAVKDLEISSVDRK